MLLRNFIITNNILKRSLKENLPPINIFYYKNKP